MTETKNFKCYKRLINRKLLQVSCPYGTPFLSYLPKRSTQIYRAKYVLAYIHINISPNALTVKTAKNNKKRPFLKTRQLCHGVHKTRIVGNIISSRFFTWLKRQFNGVISLLKVARHVADVLANIFSRHISDVQNKLRLKKPRHAPAAPVILYCILGVVP